MKKKVVIQGLPNKSSKKKVVIEGLPKASPGMFVSEPVSKSIKDAYQSQNSLTTGYKGKPFDTFNKIFKTYDDGDNTEPVIEGEAAPFQNYGITDVTDSEFATPPTFDPQRTSQLVDYFKSKGKSPQLTLTPEERTEYDEYLKGKKGTTRLKGIGIPTSSNPYINRGLTYAGQSLGHFLNASRLGKDENIKDEDLYKSSYFGPMSTGLQFEVEKAQFGKFIKDYTLPGIVSDMDRDEQQNFMGTLNAVQSVGNIAKGSVDEIGTANVNYGQLGRNARQYGQSAFNSAQNVTPYETQGYDFLGRNALAADGMQIKQIGGMGEPNIIDAPELNGYFRRKR